jgi:hypothetical protein
MAKCHNSNDRCVRGVVALGLGRCQQASALSEAIIGVGELSGLATIVPSWVLSDGMRREDEKLKGRDHVRRPSIRLPCKAR